MTARAQAVPARFGARIERERVQRGWSMRQLAAEAGVSPSTVIRAERGEDAALSTAIALAGVFGTGLDWLLAEPVCETCDGQPPARFICSECGRGAVPEETSSEGERT